MVDDIEPNDIQNARLKWLKAKEYFDQINRASNVLTDKIIMASKEEIKWWSRYQGLRTGLISTNPDYR